MAKKNKEKNILIEWLRKKYNINGLWKKGMIVFIIGAILYFIWTTFIQEYAKGLFKQKTQLPITVSVNSSTGADERDIDSYMIYMNEEYDYNFIDMYNFIDDLYKLKKIIN